MGYFSELDAEGPYRTCGEADEARRFYPDEYRIATQSRTLSGFSTVMTQVARFTSLALAESYKNREQGRWIVLGNEGEYWVCSYRYARKLVAFGYEMLEG